MQAINNISKSLRLILSAVATLMLSMSANANSNIIVQVPQTYYEHPVRLLHPYIDYWHTRAIGAQKAAQKVLSQAGFNVQSCDGNSTAQGALIVEPNMFYNPQMGVFYGQIIAKWYSHNDAAAALLAPDYVFKGEGQQLGSLRFGAEYAMQQAYTLAMQQVLQQLQQSALNKTLETAPAKNYQGLCQGADQLLKPKLFY